MLPIFFYTEIGLSIYKKPHKTSLYKEFDKTLDFNGIFRTIDIHEQSHKLLRIESVFQTPLFGSFNGFFLKRPLYF